MIINMNGAKAPETPSPVYQEKTVTPETLPTVIGADEGYDGLSQVTVNPDANLKSENIKYGKTVFGVGGSYGRQFEGGNIDVGGGAGVTSDKEFIFDVDFSEYPQQLTFNYPADIPQGMLLDPTTVKCNRPDFLLPARVPDQVTWMGVKGTSPWHMFNTQRGHKPDSFPYVITPLKEYRTMEDPISGNKMGRTFTMTYAEEVVNAPDNLTPENIKAGVTIAGVTGTYEPQPSEVTLETVVTTPESFPTVVTPSAGYDGLSRVTVHSPDNLTAENIKAGVTIAGVEGTFGGSASDSLLPKILSTKVLDRSDPFEGYDVHLSDFDELAFNGIVPYYEYNSSRIKYLEVPSDNITFQDSCFLGINSGYYTSGGYSALKPISLYFCGPNLPRRTNTFASYTLVSCCIESFPTSYLTNVSTVIKKYTMSLTYHGDVIEIPEGITGIEVNGCPITFINLNSFSFEVKGATVILPSTLTSLYSTQAVINRNCVNLSTLKIKATTPPVLNYSANDTSYKPSKIIVPIGTLEAYQTATNWSVYADIMEEATE